MRGVTVLPWGEWWGLVVEEFWLAPLWFWPVALFLLLLFSLVLTPVRIEVKAAGGLSHPALQAHVLVRGWLGITLLRWSYPPAVAPPTGPPADEIGDELAGGLSEHLRAWGGWPALRKALSILWDGAELRRLRVSVRFGLGDAAVTAWAQGAAWAVLGPLWAWLLDQPQNEDATPRLHIEPIFNEPDFRFQANCIAAVWPAHIIAAGLALLAARAQARRGGRTVWRNIQSRA